MKEFEQIEDYIEDDLVLLLSQDIFTEKPLSAVKMKEAENYQTAGKKGLAAAACILLVLAVWNFNSITAAAKGLASFLFGGMITEEMTDEYFVLGEAVTFGPDGGYTLELAYRDGSDVYAVISKNNADGLGEAGLVVNGRTYEEGNRSNNGVTVTEGSALADGTNQITRGKSELQCHFAGVEMSNDMTFLVEGQRVDVRLEPPKRFALNQNMTIKTAGVQWTVFPLAPDSSMVGISIEADRIWGDGSGQCSVELLDPHFIGASESRYEAESIGEGNQVWSAKEKIEEPIVGFEIKGVVYERHNYDEGLLSYTFSVPERGSSVVVDEALSVHGLEIRLKRISRSEDDHIELFFEPETELGILSRGSLTAEGETGHGCSSGGEEFSMSLGYTYYRMEDDHKTVKEVVHQFPYETGDEMTVTIEELEIEKEEKGEIRF